MLNDEDQKIKEKALLRVSQCIDVNWTHFDVDTIQTIESFLNNDQFLNKSLVNQVLSKFYFNLKEQDQTLKFALNCKDSSFFNINDQKDPWILKVIEIALDQHIKLIKQPQDLDKEYVTNLNAFVQTIADQCKNAKDQALILGLALDTKSIATFEGLLQLMQDNKADCSQLVSIAVHHSRQNLQDRIFRDKFLEVVEKQQGSSLDVSNVTITEDAMQQLDSMIHCFILLSKQSRLADLLHALILGSYQHRVIAFQIAYDLEDLADQNLTGSVAEQLKVKDEHVHNLKYTESLVRLKEILQGTNTMNHQLAFMKNECKSDMDVLNDMKSEFDPKVSINQVGVFQANGLCNAGTGNDTFMREQIAWHSKAKNWTMFSNIAVLGMIHKGNHNSAFQILEPYLVGAVDGAADTEQDYINGGAQQALGLIYSNFYNSKTADVFLKVLDSEKEPVLHGACLGVGLMAMGTYDTHIVNALKNVLFKDKAISGEAAAIGLGLLTVGQRDQELISEMINIAKDNSHNKVTRALAVGISLNLVNSENYADTIIETLLADQNEWMRQAGVLSLGTAYAGTSSAWAVRKLLSISATEVCSDVSKIACAMLGLVLIFNRSALCELIELNLHSQNVNIRWGSCMALGLAFASSASMQAQNLLKPLLTDKEGLVKQSAYISLGMVFNNQPKGYFEDESTYTDFKAMLEKSVKQKSEDPLARFGAMVATGALHSGGCNAQFCFTSPKTDKTIKTAVVGAVMFLQLYQWQPYIPFLSLCMKPQCLILLDDDLQVKQDLQMVCNSRPSRFSQPMRKKEEREKEKSMRKAKRDVLSVQQRINVRKAVRSGGVVEEIKKPTVEEEKKEEEVKEEEEADLFILSNPCRILYSQEAYIEYDPNDPELPINYSRKRGIVVLYKKNN